MSNYDAILCIGYLISDSDMAGYIQDVEEKSHEEERFSEKTGKSLGFVKVVDREEGEAWVFRDATYDGPTELLEDVASEVGATLNHIDDGNGGGFWFIGPSHGNSLRDIAALLPEAERIGEELRRLGFDVKEPTVEAHTSSY